MQQQTKPHFRDSLQLSNSVAKDARWEALYRQAWPGFAGMDYTTDLSLQRAGIDRLVKLDDGSVITLEEKHDIQAGANFFLEYWSSLEGQTPGWIRKPLQCEYFAYVCPSIYNAYIIPWAELQAAWIANAEAWVAQYKPKHVRNPAYTTVGVAVPISEVLRHCPGSRCFDWPEIEPQTKSVFSLGGREYSRY